MGSLENKNMVIVSKVMAQLKENDSIGASRYQAQMQVLSSHITTTSSPTPLDPTFNSNLSTLKESSDTPAPLLQDSEGDNTMTTTAINPGDLLHAVWEDLNIFYKRDGADFDPTTEALTDNDAPGVFEPKIAVSGNNVHVIWEDGTTSEIMYRRSVNSGATFGPIINLSNTPSFNSFDSAIAVSGNNVHVVWNDNTPGNFDIFYRKSTNGGASFTEPTKNLSNNAGFSLRPSIAVSGNNVHVVWDDDTSGTPDILYRRSLDNGSTFPNIIKNLSGNTGFSESPSIAVSGSNVHVVWEDDTGSEEEDILYRRSLDGGGSFPNIIKNLSDNAGSSRSPAIAASGANVHVVWDDDTVGTFQFEILYRRSLDGGATFPNIIKNISGNVVGGAANPDIAVSSNNVYVVWDQQDGVLYRTSADSGATFPNIMTDLSNNSVFSTDADIAVS
jgi:hypothetical protein